MRSVRRWWRRLRGWWLLTAAAIVTAVLSAVGQAYPGLVVAAAVAVGGVIAGVISDRGRAALTAPSAPGLYVARVDTLTDPVRLRVHRAAALDGDPVPPFVERDRLADLTNALRAGGFVLVVGDSTAGKTRLAFEAMRACLRSHMCVVPNGTVTAAITAALENRPSVLWLDDLDRYLGVGGLSTSDIRTLVDKNVVVLATIRTHERERLSERHDLGRDHTGQRLARAGREILDTVTTEIRLPRMWSERERAAAESFADDPRIAAALANADRHGLAEHLAAGPELVRDLKDARDTTTRSRGAALVTAAIDLRRAGYQRPVPLTVLRDLHETYLHDVHRAEPWDEALDWATRPLHATSSLLEPLGDNKYLAFDYLLDDAMNYPDTPPVPDAVWNAIVDFAEPVPLVEVAWAASAVENVEYLDRATAKALERKAFEEAALLADILGDAGQEPEAVAYLEAIIAAARNVVSPALLVQIRGRLAWQVGEKVGGEGDPRRALEISRDVVEDSVAALGEEDPETLMLKLILARQLGAAGQPEEALALARAVVDDARRVLRPDDHTTLSARFEAALWTWRVEGVAAGIRAFGELLDDMSAFPNVSLTLVADAQWNLGVAFIQAEQPENAAEVFDAAVVNASRARGANHVMTLDIRLSYLDAIRDAGEFVRTVELADELTRDSARVLGPLHTTTLTARAIAAVCLAEAGDRTAALQRFESLLPDLAHLPADEGWVSEVRARYESLRDR